MFRWDGYCRENSKLVAERTQKEPKPTQVVTNIHASGDGSRIRIDGFEYPYISNNSEGPGDGTNDCGERSNYRTNDGGDNQGNDDQYNGPVTNIHANGGGTIHISSLGANTNRSQGLQHNLLRIENRTSDGRIENRIEKAVIESTGSSDDTIYDIWDQGIDVQMPEWGASDAVMERSVMKEKQSTPFELGMRIEEDFSAVSQSRSKISVPKTETRAQMT